METLDSSSPDQTKWLNQIQNRSWEAELLISGGAIISLFQLADFLEAQELKSGIISFGVGLKISFLSIGVRQLILYFSFHLLARSFWLALVFLQKIYPDGIKVDKLNFAEPFRSISGVFSLIKRISAVDKYCSLIFSWAITVVPIWIGLAVASVIVFLPQNIFFDFFRESFKAQPARILGIAHAIEIIILFTLFIFLIDTLFHGLFRKSRMLARIYYPLFVFWITICLGL